MKRLLVLLIVGVVLTLSLPLGAQPVLMRQQPKIDMQVRVPLEIKSQPPAILASLTKGQIIEAFGNTILFNGFDANGAVLFVINGTPTIMVSDHGYFPGHNLRFWKVGEDLFNSAVLLAIAEM